MMYLHMRHCMAKKWIMFEGGSTPMLDGTRTAQGKQ
jgi:hypothetical protein